MDSIVINPKDNVATALRPCKKGESINDITLLEDIPQGHKYALCDLNKGDLVIKYAHPIGRASYEIKKGSRIHTHNLEGIRGRGDLD